jgi:hypothetical protein
MVSVDGVTYRIERLAPKTYGVVRVTDDVHVGTFKTGAELQVFAESIDPLLLELVARDAVMTGKTSWVMHAKPVAPPAAEPPSEESMEPPVSTRRRFQPA